ncbi:condensation domain-containing protein [Brevibacillus ginsengisoli]|uniref:condensation domain-containing protein n=1 Tax=Brevibacillus ginsengisoli TaxID=363854 RepID=UPI003CF91186
MEPLRFPVTGQDLFNYLAGYFASDHQLQVVLTFNNTLNETLMAKAVRATLELEPVLGCCFVEDQPTSYWQRREDLDTINLCSVVQTDDVEAAIQDFLTTPLNSLKDPQVQVRIIRSNYDVLCIKMDHSSTDGGGLKEYVQLLASVYSECCADPEYWPSFRQEARRDQGQIWEPLQITDPASVWDRTRNVAPTWSFPSQPGVDSNPAHVIRRIADSHYSRLVAFAREKGGTVNDLLLTAFYRAFFTITGVQTSDPMAVQVSVDLRRYLPTRHADAISNLSGAEIMQLAYQPEEPFEGTLTRVAHQMNQHKNNQPGVQIGIVMELLAGLGYSGFYNWYQDARRQALESNCFSPLLSNVGILHDQPITFGPLAAVDGYFVSPCFWAPAFMTGASSYNGVLTLTVGFYQSTVDRATVETFLDQMVQELTQL